jgi:P pilus assembly chaperone PapD
MKMKKYFWSISTNMSLLFFVTAIALFVVSSPAGAQGQGFSVGIAMAEHSACPGETVQGSLPVTNNSDKTVTLMVTLGDWKRQDGKVDGYVYVNDSEDPRSLRTWTTFKPDRITLAPHQSSSIDYEVNVPDDWDLKGSYWAAIFVGEPPSEAPAQAKSAETKSSIGLKVVFRYASVIFVTIKDTEQRDATFTNFNLEQQKGGFDAVAVMQNNGNIFMQPEVWLEIRNNAGKTVYTQSYQQITVLPESQREYRFELRKLDIPSDHYLVMIIADYGVPTLIAAQGRLALNSVGTPSS